MSTFRSESAVRCWNDCKMSGCPSHVQLAEFNNTSDSLLVYEDNEIVFGMDIEHLKALFKNLHKMRGAVEIDELFEGYPAPEWLTKQMAMDVIKGKSNV